MQCAFSFPLCSSHFLLVSCASVCVQVLLVSALSVKMKYQEELYLVQLVHVWGLIHQWSRLPWGILAGPHSMKEELGARAWQVQRGAVTKKKPKGRAQGTRKDWSQTSYVLLVHVLMHRGDGCPGRDGRLKSRDLELGFHASLKNASATEYEGTARPPFSRRFPVKPRSVTVLWPP